METLEMCQEAGKVLVLGMVATHLEEEFGTDWMFFLLCLPKLHLDMLRFPEKAQFTLLNKTGLQVTRSKISTLDLLNRGFQS